MKNSHESKDEIIQTFTSKENDILLNLAEKLDAGTEKAVITGPPTD